MRLAVRLVFAVVVGVAASALTGLAADPVPSPDGQHDFDFEFGAWTTELKRLPKPLSGSNEWVELRGTSTVRKVWEGAANLGELDVKNDQTHIQGLSLRLYNPETRQWSIYWGNRRDGSLATIPMVGGFTNGRGEFFSDETFDGKPISVRFVFSDITETSFRFEQSFSADGRKTWEPNWIATFTRVE
jgi:hypothetical protein